MVKSGNPPNQLDLEIALRHMPNLDQKSHEFKLALNGVGFQNLRPSENIDHSQGITSFGLAAQETSPERRMLLLTALAIGLVSTKGLLGTHSSRDTEVRITGFQLARVLDASIVFAQDWTSHGALIVTLSISEEKFAVYWMPKLLETSQKKIDVLQIWKNIYYQIVAGRRAWEAAP